MKRDHKTFMIALGLFLSLMVYLTSSAGGGEGSSPVSNAKAITTFSFTNSAATGTISESAKTISVTVPYGTNVTALVVTFTTTGASVKVGLNVQVSGTTPNDFTNPVAYTVTAADNTTTTYTVSVPVNASAVNVGLFKTGQIISYDTGSIDDGALQRGVAWPSPRFTTNKDTTVTDNLTGLIWAPNAGTPAFTGATSTCAAGVTTWQGALDYVACLNANSYLGHTDWRLPNRKELRSLINYGLSNNATWLNTRGFRNVAPFIYWTSTTYTARSNMAWYVDITGAGPVGVSWNLKSFTVFYVWPVRAGQSNSADLAFPSSIAKTGLSVSYATGDDGSLQRGIAWPSPRFTTNKDTTLTDNLTGLIWAPNAGTPAFTGATSTCAAGGTTWQGALDYVACLNANSYLGYNDWRLPNVNELESLFHAGYTQETCTGSPCATNAAWLSNQGFSNVRANEYWSSTTHAASTLTNLPSAWPVDMTDGNMFAQVKTLVNFYVWPVRAGSHDRRSR